MKAPSDNGQGLAKVRLRQKVALNLPATARVLEGFAGTGHLYRSCYASLAGGICMDKDRGKAEQSAIERPGWACYHGDTVKALQGAWGAWYAWDVVDLDTWGEPWPALHAWCSSKRERAPTTHLFLTDGYESRCSMAVPSKTLWPDVERDVRRSVSMTEYRTIVEARILAWMRDCGLTVSVWDARKAGMMTLHYLALTRSDS